MTLVLVLLCAALAGAILHLAETARRWLWRHWRWQRFPYSLSAKFPFIRFANRVSSAVCSESRSDASNDGSMLLKGDDLKELMHYNYKLVVYDKSGESRSHKQKRDANNDIYDRVETRYSPMERAEEFRSKLEPAFPSFAKALIRSNVTVGFWMHLPMRFCKLYLPKNDATIFLQNDNGEEFITNYIAERTALSGGWKAFCAGNNLVEGDVLIFHLVKPLRFKVYVVRGSGHENQIERAIADLADKDNECNKKAKPLAFLPADHLEENNREKSLIVMETNKVDAAIQSESESEDNGSEIREVIKSSGSANDFEDVDGFDNFRILVNGSAIDSELSNQHRAEYYDLCCSQNSFLHDNLLASLNSKLAAEIIIETVKISMAVRSSKLSNSRSDYAVWDKTLKGFELLGMNVGFLRTRLKKLLNLVLETEAAMESESREARNEQARVNEERKSIETKLLKLKETKEKLDGEIEALKSNAEKHELKFQEVVLAPW